VAKHIVNEILWRKLVEIARRRRMRPEDLANAALRGFLRRVAEDELLEESSRAAQKTSFPISETEAILRQFRNRLKD
jgi:hypothetical protein